MFGGLGVYRQGAMFALIAGETLCFKADAELARAFLERGLGPFEYARKGRPARLAYYQAPAEVDEDQDEVACWRRRSLAVALRAARSARGARRGKA